MKTISILGSTGSIGTQTLEVARWRGYRVAALAAGRNWQLLVEQAREFRPRLVACHQDVAEQLRRRLPSGIRLASGEEGVNEVAAFDVDTVVSAIPGMAGLEPTAHALAAGLHVALANKEAMVVAGPLMLELAERAGALITPLDSEHSALYQCLRGEESADVHALVLTASGGPFREQPADLWSVTPKQALAHPNWTMGAKVSVDSATLFNKGLEVLEAHFLFGVPLERIEVVIHPQSLIHGLVRFRDGSIKAQIGPHDMRLPIQYGIEAPRRPAIPLSPLPLRGEWQFLPPDEERFPCLPLAYRAGEKGGFAPVYLNAADEVAVEAFLGHRLPFPAIAEVIAEVLEKGPGGVLVWSDLSAADSDARSLARQACNRLARKAPV
ncbi:MAG: 1-deoxy-D-xylulose-5-phosphate reductoisomerase [Trueperaceae bacterium]